MTTIQPGVPGVFPTNVNRASAVQSRIESQIGTIAGLNASIQAVMAELAALQPPSPQGPDEDPAAYQRRLAEFQRKVDQLNQKLQGLQTKLAQAQATLNRLEAELSAAEQKDSNELRKALEEARKQLEEALKAAAERFKEGLARMGLSSSAEQRVFEYRLDDDPQKRWTAGWVLDVLQNGLPWKPPAWMSPTGPLAALGNLFNLEERFAAAAPTNPATGVVGPAGDPSQVQVAADGRPLGVSEAVWNRLPPDDRQAIIDNMAAMQAAAVAQSMPVAETQEFVEVRSLDISHHSGEITQEDLDAWYDAGFTHLVVGLGENQYGDRSQQQFEAIFNDGRFTADAYFFMYPNECSLYVTGQQPGSIEDQMEAAIEKIGDWPIGRFWIDLENNPDRDEATWGLTPEEMVDRLQRAVDHSNALLAENGRDDVELGIYTGVYFWQAEMGNSEQFSDLPLWYAHWTGDDTEGNGLDSYGNNVPAVGGWDQPLARQYAGDTTVPGNDIDVDMNIMYIPRAQYEAVHGPWEGEVLTLTPDGTPAPVDPTVPVDPTAPVDEPMVGNPAMVAYLEAHPEIKTNQDLINELWNTPQGSGWDHFASGCEELGIETRPLLDNRQGDVWLNAFTPEEYNAYLAGEAGILNPDELQETEYAALMGLGRGDTSNGEAGSPIAVLHDFLLHEGYVQDSFVSNVGFHNTFGPKTEAAVKTFQHENGLPATGTIDAATVAAMNDPRPRPAGLAAPMWRAFGEQLGLATGPYEVHADGSARQEFENGYVAIDAEGVRYVRDYDNVDLVPPMQAIGLAGSVEEANLHFLTQWGPTDFNDPPTGSDVPWGYLDCGPTSVAMCLSALGLLEHPDKASAYMTIDEVRDACFGWDTSAADYTGATQLNRGLEASGAELEELEGTIDSLDEALMRGNPVILGGRVWDAWGADEKADGNYLNSRDPGGHWVTVMGQTPDGSYLVGDPLVKGGTIEVSREQMEQFFTSSANAGWTDVLEVSAVEV